MPKKGDSVEVVSHTNRDVVGHIGTVTSVSAGYCTVEFDPPIERQPPVIAITFVEATAGQLKKVRK